MSDSRLNREQHCGDPGALVSYLYGDASAEELASIDAHVRGCEACATELATLGQTRTQLTDWAPPAAALGFRIAREPAAEAPSLPWWRQPTPAWMQAVAAVLIFGVGLGVGASRLGSDAGVADAPPVAVASPEAVSQQDLTGLETRLRAEMARLSAAASVERPAAVVADGPARDEALVQRVRALLTESEERQRRELALRITQVARDGEVQRMVDMAKMQQAVGQLQGTTGAELKRQGELYRLLMNNASLTGGGR